MKTFILEQVKVLMFSCIALVYFTRSVINNLNKRLERQQVQLLDICNRLGSGASLDLENILSHFKFLPLPPNQTTLNSSLSKQG